jgi:hypothetical protein
MPAVICKCGDKTNTAVSEVWNHDDWGVKADSCYAKVNDQGAWVKGCTEPMGYMKLVVRALLENKKPPSTPEEMENQKKNPG